MISRRASGVESSGIRRMFELVSNMEDPINLSIGQAHFDVPEPIKDAASAAIHEDFSRYTVTQGLPELNEAVLARLAARHGYGGRHSMITCGVSGGLMLGFMALLDPGDEILVPDPYFTMYPVLARMCNGEPVCYDAYPGATLDGTFPRLLPTTGTPPPQVVQKRWSRPLRNPTISAPPSLDSP